MSPPEVRLRHSDRRAKILDAATPLFACAQGFHGVSVRQLADAAGVSEALLYRHFKSKEALYAAIQAHCMSGVQQQAEHIAAMEPSTQTLVLSVYLVAHKIVGSAAKGQPEEHIPRLILNSLLSDGEFARVFLKKSFERWFPKLRECVVAARKQKDLEGEADDVAFWLLHHVAAMTCCMSLPKKPAVNYGVAREELVEHVARFALRGLGLTESALQRHFNPKTLAMLFRP